MMMTAFFKLTLIAGAIASINAPAIAQNADDGTVVSGENRDLRTIYVQYGDLNLSSAADVKRLQSRVRGAARTICLSPGLKPLNVMMSEQKCYSEAMDGAEPQIADAVRRNGTGVANQTAAITMRRKAG
jgi:UrcA family protein